VNVLLLCTACGHRLTEPLRLLPEVPPRPEYEGRKNPDGSRHAPATMPRGTYAVDPEPCGAPYVPHPDPDWCDAANPGNVCMGDPDGQGFLMSAGPRDTLVVHPGDARERLEHNPATTEFGCCGPPGREGPNAVCGGCGAVAATEFRDCTGAYETHFLPEAVRVSGA
jgi:hypothetical protein